MNKFDVLDKALHRRQNYHHNMDGSGDHFLFDNYFQLFSHKRNT
jgi:hypothetical protein